MATKQISGWQQVPTEVNENKEEVTRIATTANYLKRVKQVLKNPLNEKNKVCPAGQ